MWRKLIALIFLFILTVPWYRSHLFALDFVDEEDNIVIGSYLNNEVMLYRDVYSQHQPAQFVIANALQTLTTPDNIYMTVKRHREFMIIWSMIWIILLVFSYGYPLYFVSLVIELTKILFLGNMFLAESFVIYPLLYLYSYVFVITKISRLSRELFVLGIIWFLALSLTPLWPILLAISIYLYATSATKPRFIFYFVAIGITALALLSSKVDFLDYYHDAIWINTNFYIPLTTGISTFSTIFYSILSPFITLFAKGESILLPLLKVLSIIYLVNIYVLFRVKKYFQASFLYLILFLANLRYIDPSNTLYGAFHMLPWYSTLLFGSIVFINTSKLIRILMVTLIILFSLPIARQLLWDRRDLNTDFFVHYSPSADLSLAVNIITRDKPLTLWVEPVNYWLHYQNNSLLYTSMINYYPWMNLTPSLKDELTRTLELNLPDIVYHNNQNLALGEKIEDYIPLIRDGNKSGLYLRRDHITTLSVTQKDQLAFYRFTF